LAYRLELSGTAAKLIKSGMKSVLVAIDFSTATPRVLEFAGQLAKILASEIHLVHVKELVPAIPPSAIGYGMAGMPELMPMSTLPLADPNAQAIMPNELDKKKLAAWRSELEREGLKVTSHDLAGNIVEEILRTAEQTKADLIVMGRHGHGAMYNLLVGSVTEGVLKHSLCPVVLVPELRS
jgi:nucleotide-binding universal stress UspA family protein